MQGDFFRLDSPFQESDSEADFIARLQAERISDVLYRPDEFAPRKPMFRIQDKTFKNISFSKTILREIDFRNCRFEDSLFVATELIDCEFHDCSFANCNTHKIIFRNTYVDPQVFAKMLDPVQHTNIGVHLFQQLLKNSNETAQPQFRDTAEYHFRIWRLRQWSYDKNTSRITPFQFFRKWLPEFLYLWVAGFGLRSRYFVFWTIVFFASIVYINHRYWSCLGISNSGSPVLEPSLIRSAYFSFVTLTTLGYGDLVPTSDMGMALITFEAMAGLVWVSILASIIIRRIVR